MRSRSATGRLLHTVSYEFFALLITIPGAAWIMDKPIGGMGITAIVLSISAMVWNLVFNIFFDRRFPPHAPRGPVVRTLQAVGFEGGFVVIAVPLTAVMLSISPASALMLDIGFLMFYLPYTYLFNWCWDKLPAAINRLRRSRPCIR
ncbi:PACE efflux transporter [Tatumella morbirosei]|uniref:PACE efflux transporter n=1 Tax=Tatumella morbirosei TaxID=642227 RepID=UPI00062A3E1E|nr:PACE efflux transporter [Tatumella morbirosei]